MITSYPPHCYRAEAALLALDSEWDRVASNDERATPFQRAGWLRAWIESVAVAEGQNPVILKVPASGPLRIGLPVQLSAARDERELTHLGSPWVDYEDAISNKATDVDVNEAARLLSELAKAEAAKIVFREVRVDGLLHRILARLDGQFSTSSETSSVDLTDTQHTVKVCSRSEHTVKRRRLERLGTVKLRRNRDWASISRALPTFVNLHLQQWAKQGQAVAPFTIQSVRQGFEALLNSAADSGFADLTELTLNDQPIAGYIGFQEKNTYFAYRTTYDISMRTFSPGHLMLQALLRCLCQESVTRFDFMRGAYPYKADYATFTTTNLSWCANT